MRPQDSQSGRRPRRGGSGRPRRGGRSNYGESNNNPNPPAPAKKTFFQKIAAFFTGSASKPAARAPQNGQRQRAETGYRSETTSRPTRKPELVEVSSPKLYVGNLSFDATETDLFELFNGVGEVKNAEIVSHKYTQKSKGFAFVTMQTIDEAKRAVTELHDKEFMGRKLVVSGAKTSDVSSMRNDIQA